MAAPQVTGAMAVLIQYLDERYPNLTGAAQRRTAANLLMSTADPILFGENLEYSPRWQGAGLVNLSKATATPVYLSNPAAFEGRPKAELGDDPTKGGVYSFAFDITNLSEYDVTYAFRPSVMTEGITTLYGKQYLAAEPYGLTAGVEVRGYSGGSFLKYDFNEDGRITTADARVLLRHVNGVETIGSENRHSPYLDVNGDGRVNRADAEMLVNYCAGMTVSANLLSRVFVGAEEQVNQITVPAGGTVNLSATLTLSQADKQYLNQFPNGIYVEGYLYAEPVGTEDQEGNIGPRLTLPMMGFYGDWSKASVFDAEGEEAVAYARSVYTRHAQVGSNPYIRASQRKGDAYNAFSYANPLDEIDFCQMRNTKKLTFSVLGPNNEEYYSLSGYNTTKSYYVYPAGMIIPTYVLAEQDEVWNGLDQNGNKLPDGTRVTYRVQAWLDDGDDLVDDTFEFQITLDDKAPEVLNRTQLQQGLRTENGRTTLTLKLKDQQAIAAVLFVSSEGVIMRKDEVVNRPGVEEDFTFDVTGFGSEFKLVVADYACNETEIAVSLDSTGHYLGKGSLVALDPNRLYGCETYDVAAVEPGWFSASKADLSDYRNETYDSTNRYYSAEYVNGYLVAQSAITGDLLLITPSGSYWSQQTIATQNGKKIGDAGSWVLYDMALDYSDIGSGIYDPAGNAAGKDTLYAVGWLYGGDQNGDGKDDGYNALFRIWVAKSNAAVTVEPVARLTGTRNEAEVLTLGCTTDGKLYGIDNNAILYEINPNRTGSVGDYTVSCQEVGTTDFVKKQGFSGVNVIQSMGYDHNTGTMYWYAVSQTPSDNRYIHVCQTYKVNLTNGKCTEVGSYGASGMTCLFVPTSRTSDWFQMGVEPTGFQPNPQTLTIVQGQVRKLDVDWQPWNATPGQVEWSSEDTSKATVDQRGFVTAVSGGTVTIWATATVSGSTTQRVGCTVTVLPSQSGLYSYIISDYKNASNDRKWVTYSDRDVGSVRPISAPGGNLWQGGAYYNGYLYTTQMETVQGEDMTEQATVLYKSKVTPGATPEQTTIGTPQRVGHTVGIETGNMGFDYSTGSMYCVDLTNGGLAIIDLDTGAIDLRGEFKGEIGGGVIAPAMCVTADGTIVVSNMFGALFTVDPNTMETTRIGGIQSDTWYYGAMTYDYNTGSIYWNPCMGQNASSLYLVGLDASGARPVADIMKLGNISTEVGVEQTVMFTIPTREPETRLIPVTSISITNGETISGVKGSTARLTTVTEPATSSVRTRSWTSTNENVVQVDRFGVLTYTGVGTATVTVSMENKGSGTVPSVRDSITVTVYEAAGELRAFLNNDLGGTGYYDFWITLQDHDLSHATVGERTIGIYSLRSGTYYDGYYYGYNDKGEFLRINAANTLDFKVLGSHGLTDPKEQVTAVAMDYTTSTLYGLTNPVRGNGYGRLVTIDLNTGRVTNVATLNEYVTALAADKNGILYAAGGPNFYSDGALYTLDKSTGGATKVMELPGARVWTGTNEYNEPQYNSQMAYDFGSHRLYLNATSDDGQFYERSSGLFMIELGERPTLVPLGEISLYTRAGAAIKRGDVFLGLLAFLPKAEQIQDTGVNGVLLNKEYGRVAVGKTTRLEAAVRPTFASNKSLNWTSSNPAVATVKDGVVTGVAPGTATITATSVENPSISAKCEITVVSLTGEQPTAYTISARQGGLISFNPRLPAQTATRVAELSGGSNIKGMAAGATGLYYAVDNGGTFAELFRYDLLTKQSTSLGRLNTWTEIYGIAVDEERGYLYAVAGFYLFQYDLRSLRSGTTADCLQYYYDSTPNTLIGVACVDGAVYTLGAGYWTTELTLNKFADYKLKNPEVVVRNIQVAAVEKQTEFSYHDGLFYVTSANHMIYTLDMDGKVTPVDLLGDGIDLNGLAIVPGKGTGSASLALAEEGSEE